MANLAVSVDGADGFVCTLSSSWCSLTLMLERTRGDGGYDFQSVDSGSQYTTCF